MKTNDILYYIWKELQKTNKLKAIELKKRYRNDSLTVKEIEKVIK